MPIAGATRILMALLNYGALGDLAAGAIYALTATLLLTAIFVGAPLWCFATLVAACCWTFGAPWWLAPARWVRARRRPKSWAWPRVGETGLSRGSSM